MERVDACVLQISTRLLPQSGMLLWFILPLHQPIDSFEKLTFSSSLTERLLQLGSVWMLHSLVGMLVQVKFTDVSIHAEMETEVRSLFSYSSK